MGDREVALRGGLWTSISTAVTMLAQIARVVVLTRFLVKSDFGLVSITNMVILLCTTFTDLGFSSAIMYKRDLSQKEFSSLYWTQFIAFGAIFLLLILFSPLVAQFYNEESLKLLLPISGLSIVFQAIGKLYDSVLQKQYRFKLIAFRNIIANILSLLSAIWMAVNGYGVYSLIFSTLCNILIYNVWNLITGLGIYRIKLCLDIKGVLPLIKIGLYQTGVRILDFFSGKIDVIIIGKLLGTELLGVYDLAKELIFKFVSFFQTVITKVALPILSNNNSDDNLVVTQFLRITKTVAYICMPICMAVALFSEPIVLIMYGQTFIEAAPLVSIFAVFTMFSSFLSIFDLLGITKGRTDLNFKGTIYRVIVSTVIVLLTSLISITAVAIGQIVILAITAIISWIIIIKPNYNIPIKLYIQQFSKLLLVLLLVSFSVVILRDIVLSDAFNNWIVSFVVYGLFYFVALGLGAVFFLKGDMKYYMGLIKEFKYGRK